MSILFIKKGRMHRIFYQVESVRRSWNSQHGILLDLTHSGLAVTKGLYWGGGGGFVALGLFVEGNGVAFFYGSRTFDKTGFRQKRNITFRKV